MMTTSELVLVAALLVALYAADALQRRMYADYKDTFIFFFADWCDHCRRFKGEWATFQQNAPKSLAGMRTTAAESSDGGTMKLFGVSSYPTLVYIDRAGRRHDYGGSRNSGAMITFAGKLR